MQSYPHRLLPLRLGRPTDSMLRSLDIGDIGLSMTLAQKIVRWNSSYRSVDLSLHLGF
jgi:hypothetical protein